MTSSAPWTVGWYLVEAGEPIPLNAIPTGHEGGGSIFSVRVWHEGGLTLGKYGRHHRGIFQFSIFPLPKSVTDALAEQLV